MGKEKSGDSKPVTKNTVALMISGTLRRSTRTTWIVLCAWGIASAILLGIISIGREIRLPLTMMVLFGTVSVVVVAFLISSQVHSRFLVGRLTRLAVMIEGTEPQNNNDGSSPNPSTRSNILVQTHSGDRISYESEDSLSRTSTRTDKGTSSQKRKASDNDTAL